jgi:hypothetical protein
VVTPSNHNFLIKPKHPLILGGSSIIRRRAHHNNDQENAFHLISIPLLASPDFTKTFKIECDASGIGIEAILM